MPVARTSATASSDRARAGSGGRGSSGRATTSTSRLRGEKTPRRWTSTKRGGLPAAEQRLHRRVVELDVPDREHAAGAAAAAISASASARLAAIGFSTSTWTPRASSAQPSSAWATVGAATTAASISPGQLVERVEDARRRAPRATACRRLGPRVVDPDQLDAGERDEDAGVVPARARRCRRRRPRKRDCVRPGLSRLAPPSAAGRRRGGRRVITPRCAALDEGDQVVDVGVAARTRLRSALAAPARC